jgi:hypothetical protein
LRPVSNVRLTLLCLALSGCAHTTLERDANDVASPEAVAAPLPEGSRVLADGFDPAAAYDIVPEGGSGGHHHHGGARDAAPADPHAGHRMPAPSSSAPQPAPQPPESDGHADHGDTESEP